MIYYLTEHYLKWIFCLVMRGTRGRAQARQAHVPNLVIQSELRIRQIQRLFTEPVIHVYWEKLFLPSIHKE